MKDDNSDITEADRICRFSKLHVMMLDNRFRRLLVNPEKILKDHISPGMTVIDIGCGPGTFTGALAGMTGEEGTVIACDVQEEMIGYARKKYEKKDCPGTIRWHLCESDSLCIKDTEADFALSFFMVHEVPDMNRLFTEVYELLKPGGKYLVAEPVFHVNEEDFNRTIKSAEMAGFVIADRPGISMSRSVILLKEIS
ncbi:MAG: class I SAM-dependent methyltransferase [Methanomicrobiaceae archaeon]|nr:class I SAM-dependent methyltransferase [Methanomicrobiaceae archaeon]